MGDLITYVDLIYIRLLNVARFSDGCILGLYSGSVAIAKVACNRTSTGARPPASLKCFPGLSVS